MAKWIKAMALAICLTLALPCVMALAETADGGDTVVAAQDITSSCSFKLSEGKAKNMLDDKLSTGWKNSKAKAKIVITLPADQTAGGLYIEWYKKPGNYTITEYDKNGEEVASYGRNSAYTGVVNYFPLTSETKKVLLTLSNKNEAISTLRIYTEGELPDQVQNWSAPLEKADLMVIAAHPGDEYVYFGGAIPYYGLVRDKDVEVVYMSNCGRARTQEALNGLWAIGMTNYPEFVGLANKSTKTLTNGVKAWGGKNAVLKVLVARIRRYQPEVIVTHDLKGEDGHGAHRAVANLISEAITMAADSTKFKDSYESYGVWQVKKLYLHLGEDKQITMDWNTAYDELDGATPLEAAKTAFSEHGSQQKTYSVESGGQYDNALYGLAMSTVGDDVEKNDFFENIPETVAPLIPEETDSSQAAPDETTPDETEPDAQEDLPMDLIDEPENYPELPVDTLETDPEVMPTMLPVGTDSPADGGVNWSMIALLAGVPVVLGGGAFGYTYGRKYLKKRRREARRAARRQDGTDV